MEDASSVVAAKRDFPHRLRFALVPLGLGISFLTAAILPRGKPTWQAEWNSYFHSSSCTSAMAALSLPTSSAHSSSNPPVAAASSNTLARASLSAFGSSKLSFGSSHSTTFAASSSSSDNSSSRAQLIQQNDEQQQEKGSSSKLYNLKLETLSGCRLGVAWYPDFSYNAEGGGGIGVAEELEDGKIAVRFDPSSMLIPPVCYSTTRFLGVPLPPPLRIDVKPRVLQGVIDFRTGHVELKFVADFFFTASSLYQPPALFVDTLLTTGSCQGLRRNGQGSKLDENGQCKLVGTAKLTRVNDAFLDTFLTLPSECLAEMSARFQIQA